MVFSDIQLSKMIIFRLRSFKTSREVSSAFLMSSHNRKYTSGLETVVKIPISANVKNQNSSRKRPASVLDAQESSKVDHNPILIE